MRTPGSQFELWLKQGKKGRSIPPVRFRRCPSFDVTGRLSKTISGALEGRIPGQFGEIRTKERKKFPDVNHLNQNSDEKLGV